MINQNNKNILLEILLRCGDTDTKDFDLTIYEKMLLNSDREIVRRYNILNRVYTFNCKNESELVLNIPNFRTEYAVFIGDIKLTKVNKEIIGRDNYCYYLEYINDKYVFSYRAIESSTINNNIKDLTLEEDYKNVSNEIVIMYEILPNDNSYRVGTYLIPDNYNEERISKTIVEICKLGIGKFAGDKKQKYLDLIQLYKSNDDINEIVAKNSAWIRIKPFDILGD